MFSSCGDMRLDEWVIHDPRGLRGISANFEQKNTSLHNVVVSNVNLVVIPILFPCTCISGDRDIQTNSSAVLCEPLDMLPHTVILYKTENITMYSCMDGYFHKKGNLTRKCLSDRSWSGTVPVCVGQYVKKLLLQMMDM